jgi:hypothetical protein
LDSPLGCSTFAHITQLPVDALDPYTEFDKKVGVRTLGAGAYRVLPVQIDALPHLKLARLPGFVPGFEGRRPGGPWPFRHLHASGDGKSL